MQFYNTELNALCCANLKQALNPNTALYDRQIRNQRWENTWGTENLTSTCICLIGIHRAGIEPYEVALEPQKTLNALYNLAKQEQYLGGIGLIIWANAVWNGISLAELQQETNISLDHLANKLVYMTSMELAWLVSGLLHEYQRTQDSQTLEYSEIAIKVLLTRYQAINGLMIHADAAAPLSHRLRRWVANFADQIYSVQAFSFASIILDHEETEQVATDLANQLIALQGDLGQWWWHYDPRDGQVAQSYPVYSVHQHAMAPMALLALSAASGVYFDEAIHKSHAWLEKNELQINMIDYKANTVWRDINYKQGRLSSLTRKGRSLLGWKRKENLMPPLQLNYETRPYEWGWCLYAGAIALKRDKQLHIV